MSAHCERCGADIVYPAATWPLGTCARCDMEKRAEAAEADVARLRDGLRHIGYEMPVEERNPDGDEQAAYSMQLYARALLADQDGAAQDERCAKCGLPRDSHPGRLFCPAPGGAA